MMNLNFRKPKTEIELKMNEIGYKFITNFDNKDELLYRYNAVKCGLNYKIIEAYDIYGKQVPCCKAFYISTKCSDLTNFWKHMKTKE